VDSSVEEVDSSVEGEAKRKKPPTIAATTATPAAIISGEQPILLI
jgi:hypothetical protein